MKLFLLALGIVILSSCKKQDNNVDPTTQVYADISYGADVRQKEDIYLPEAIRHFRSVFNALQPFYPG